MSRPDDPLAIELHKNRFYGGVALCVLGGPSGKDWKRIQDEVKPDVLLTANQNTNIGADYWMLAENMSYQHFESIKGDKRGEDFMKMLSTSNNAKVKLINHRNYVSNGAPSLIDYYGVDISNAIIIRRVGWELLDHKTFTLREYGDGFFYGPIFFRKECVKPSIRFHVGTVACHLIHLAGILGCFEVHTIGMDFCFKEGKHHWYNHPKYVPARFRTEKMFTNYGDIPTLWEWVDGAGFLKSIEWLFERDNLKWTDHSNGLLKAMELKCTV